jgi:glycosyltransferase involved in cell wall biosynthesis
LPDFVGPWGFVKNYLAVKRRIVEALAEVEAIQLRIPCSIGAQVCNCLEAGRPYGVEVVADPYDSFAPGAYPHPLRAFFRWWFPRRLRRDCGGACAAGYVTAEALQRRYPCPQHSAGFSDVNLGESDFVSVPRGPRQDRRPFTLVMVGALAQLYKAPDVLIDAVATCVRQGLDLRLVFVGDGQYRPMLQQRAVALGIGERVCFRGQLTGSAAVRTELDQADLFVLASRQEGLPKAMVEAMARALPCIGSTVGGIPELLPADALVPPGDSAALAAKIREVVTNPQRLSRMARENLATAHQYREEILREKRVAFYQYVREQTAAWFAGRKEKSGPVFV